VSPTRSPAPARAPQRTRKPAWDALSSLFGLAPPASEPATSAEAPRPPEATPAATPAAVTEPPRVPQREHGGFDKRETFGSFAEEDNEEDEESLCLDASLEAEASDESEEDLPRRRSEDEGEPGRRKRRRRRRGGRGRRERLESERAAGSDDFAEREHQREHLASELITSLDSEAVEIDEMAERLEAISPLDYEMDTVVEGEEAAEGEREPRRRRRRRRRGRKDRDGEEAARPRTSDVRDSEDDETSEDASMEFAPYEIGAEDDDEDGIRASHKGIPSWKEMIETIISTNMAARAKNPRGSSGPPRRNGGRGGRGKRPSRG
jgi:ribonuclease E